MQFIRFFITFAAALFYVATMQSQEQSTSVFNFLQLPTSAHATALGGTNVSLPNDDATLFFANPALMSNASDRSIALGFFTYMQGAKAGNASWVKAAGERGTWALGAQFVSYGTMKEMNVEGIQTGSFSAIDLLLTGGYAYTLTERLAGGATGKFIYSRYGHFSSIGLAVDVGLNYFNEDADFSLSLVAANLGGQVKAFGDHHERLPYDLRIGFTKRLAQAPLRFSVTMTDLTRWCSSDYYNPQREEKAGKILLNHFVAGVDILIGQLFYVSAGYNFRRANELKAAGSSHAAGLCFGAGLELKRLKLSAAYAKYHVSMPSFMLTAQYHL